MNKPANYTIKTIYIPFWSLIPLTRNGPWMTLMSIITNEPTQLLLRQPYYLLGMICSRVVGKQCVMYTSFCSPPHAGSNLVPAQWDSVGIQVKGQYCSWNTLFWPLLPINGYQTIGSRYIFLVKELFNFIVYLKSESVCSVFKSCWRPKKLNIFQFLEERYSIQIEDFKKGTPKNVPHMIVYSAYSPNVLNELNLLIILLRCPFMYLYNNFSLFYQWWCRNL